MPGGKQVFCCARSLYFPHLPGASRAFCNKGIQKMSATQSKEICQRNCWMIGGGVGLLGLLLMWFAGDYSFIASLFWGVLLGVIVGLVLTYLLCGKQSGSAAAGAGLAATATAPEPVEKPAETEAAENAADEAALAVAEASETAAVQAGAVSESADDAASSAAEDAAPAADDIAAAAAKAASPTSEGKDSPASDLGEDYDGDGILEGANEGTRPEALAAPREGGPDNLKQIRGVGPKMEGLLHSFGFYHFDQIASWSADEVAWVDANLQGFRGRVSRDKWVEQAKLLASGAETDFSKKVQKGGVY